MPKIRKLYVFFLIQIVLLAGVAGIHSFLVKNVKLPPDALARSGALLLTLIRGGGGLPSEYAPPQVPYKGLVVLMLVLVGVSLLYSLIMGFRMGQGFVNTKSNRKDDPWNLAQFLVGWALFSFIFPGKVRHECFEPAYNDLLEDYMRARKFRGKWARRWIAFAFAMRTLFMVADCFRVLLQSGTGKIILGLLPESARNWWRRQ